MKVEVEKKAACMTIYAANPMVQQFQGQSNTMMAEFSTRGDETLKSIMMAMSIESLKKILEAVSNNNNPEQAGTTRNKHTHTHTSRFRFEMHL